MTTSSIVFGLGLALLTAFLVALPFYRNSVQVDSTRSGGQRLHLLERKAVIYAAIREIDSDVQVGKLEPADHRVLRQRYVAEGVVVLKALDALSSGDEIDTAIERDVAHLSAGEQFDSGELFCVECGVQADAGDRYCARCGAQLEG
jgi:hypothetical protein